MKQYDVLVIGSGAAGLALALHVGSERSVAVLSKTNLQDGSSYYAQGGVAAVAAAQDSFASHIHDTLEAGRGLCDPVVVEYVVTHAPAAIEWLINIGVAFSKENDDYHLMREGGHTHRRVWHAADATGRVLKTTLDQQVLAHPNIKVYESSIAIDLIVDEGRCVGAYVFNTQTRMIETFQAQHVVLATGGASRAYLYSTNPVVSSGDGIAMAYRAGCRVANMEFNQFHPTCLYHPEEHSFLISEVLRGEGAYLRLPNGQRFMSQYDPAEELAPRDTVARAIDDQMKRNGVEHVYLDITHKSPEFIRATFPMIVEKCLSLGIDITKEWIPVVPAAHYTCGGVMTTVEAKTDVDRLYAVGEVAYTGLHGANRMASNSLLECLVFAKAASEHILSDTSADTVLLNVPDWDESRVKPSEQKIVVTHSWQELRRTMWDYVGIVRCNHRLDYALKRITMLKQEVDAYYATFKVSRNLIELRNLVLVGELIVKSALARTESRGLHYTTDYCEVDIHQASPTILSPAQSAV